MGFFQSAWSVISKSLRIVFLVDFVGEVTPSQGLRITLSTVLNLAAATTKVISSYAISTAFKGMTLSTANEPGKMDFLGSSFTPLQLLYIAVGLQGFNQLEEYIKGWLIYNIGEQVSSNETIKLIRVVNHLHVQDYNENYQAMQFDRFHEGLLNAHHAILGVSIYNIQPQISNLSLGIVLTFYFEGSALGGLSLLYLVTNWFLNEIRMHLINEGAAKEKMIDHTRNYHLHMQSLTPAIRQLITTYGRMEFESNLVRDLYLKNYTDATNKYSLATSAKVSMDLVAVAISLGYIAYIGRDGFVKAEIAQVSYMLAYITTLSLSSRAINNTVTDATVSFKIIDRSSKIVRYFNQLNGGQPISRGQLIQEINDGEEKFSALPESATPTESKVEITVIDEKGDTVSKETKKPLSSKSTISVNDLKFFRQPDKPIFDKFKLEIGENELVVICGDSARGKSTLMQLLTNFLKPKSGSILLNGQEIEKIKDISEKITYVPQEPVLFEDKPVIYNMLYAMSRNENLLQEMYQDIYYNQHRKANEKAIDINKKYGKDKDFKHCVRILNDCGLLDESRNYDLYLMPEIDEEECRKIKNNAVILVNDNTAAVVVNGIIIKQVNNINRQEFAELKSGTQKVNMPLEARAKIINEVTLKSGLTILNRGDCRVSGGQKKRIAVAMALAKGNKMILFDEVTTNLDPESERVIINLICQLKNTTRIVVTHQPEKFRAHADKEYELTKIGLQLKHQSQQNLFSF